MTPGPAAVAVQQRRNAWARTVIAVALLVALFPFAVLFGSTADDSALGRSDAVMSMTMAAHSFGALCLVVVNVRLACSGRGDGMAGPSDMVAVLSLLLPVFATSLMVLLARPFPSTKVWLLFVFLLACLQLLSVAVGTRRAARAMQTRHVSGAR